MKSGDARRGHGSPLKDWAKDVVLGVPDWNASLAGKKVDKGVGWVGLGRARNRSRRSDLAGHLGAA